MITTISGKEEKVIESLRNRVVSEGMEDLFDLEVKENGQDGFRAMMIPTLSDKELEKKNNGESFKIKNKNLFPGYIFIKMTMTNEA